MGGGDPAVAEPDPELYRLVPESRRRGYDMRTVLRRLVDGGEFLELRPLIGRSLITCLARLDGWPVGILASQPLQQAGVLGPEACDKATKLIVLCDAFGLPLVFLQDVPGFLVGRQVEHARMLHKAILFQQALHLAEVPKLTVVLRKAFGLAYFALAGNDQGADLVCTWPGAEIGFMDPDVGASVLYGTAAAAPRPGGATGRAAPAGRHPARCHRPLRRSRGDEDRRGHRPRRHPGRAGPLPGPLRRATVPARYRAAVVGLADLLVTADRAPGAVGDACRHGHGGRGGHGGHGGRGGHGRDRGRRAEIAPFYVMEMMRAATQRLAAGGEVLHLEVGQPSTGAPAAVVAAAEAALRSGDPLGYTEAKGWAPLRHRLAGAYAERYGVGVDPERLLLTVGSSVGFVLAFLAAFPPGARVAVSEPGYPCYRNTLLGPRPPAGGGPRGPGHRLQPDPGVAARRPARSTGWWWPARPTRPAPSSPRPS